MAGTIVQDRAAQVLQHCAGTLLTVDTDDVIGEAYFTDWGVSLRRELNAIYEDDTRWMQPSSYLELAADIG